MKATNTRLGSRLPSVRDGILRVAAATPRLLVEDSADRGALSGLLVQNNKAIASMARFCVAFAQYGNKSAGYKDAGAIHTILFVIHLLGAATRILQPDSFP